MQSSSNFRLIVRRGPQPNQIYDLNKGIITLGRDITNDIVINDPEVSRHHCRLTQGGGGFTIEDLGSTNGTFLNGQRLTGARPLSHGDMLGLGETVTLAYESASAADAIGAAAAATMPGGPVPSAPAQPSPYQQPGGYAQQTAAPDQYGMQGQQPYGGPQQPLAYDYEYDDEPYEGGGASRWVILGCGCFLVLCIVTSVIGGIIVDAKCWWDDIPVLDLNVKEDATCR
ncbi:MAG: FHA domain-containing protein [Anaerolineae bacterium]|nr:FHA domain-containing protein [Anaerolineae bacterium]